MPPGPTMKVLEVRFDQASWLVIRLRHAEDEGSVQELESLDPQKRELLEARFLGRVSSC